MSRMTMAVAAFASLIGVALVASPAFAQSANCSDIQTTLQQRKDLVAQANSGASKKQKMTPQAACGLFTKLVGNGQGGLKWIEANKDWCQIPDSFTEGFKADHTKVLALKTKICGAAAQQAKLEKQARTQAQNSGGGLLGGPGLSGAYKLPQGAL